MTRILILAVPLAFFALAGCSQDEKSKLQSDLDQTGDSASNTLQGAKDTAQQSVHDAAQNVADDTSSD